MSIQAATDATLQLIDAELSVPPERSVCDDCGDEKPAGAACRSPYCRLERWLEGKREA